MRFRLKDILALEVSPALGCTEPTAVALGAAAATSILPEGNSVDAIRTTLSPNVFKNGMAVNIPGTDGHSGLELASAMGCISGRAEKKMQVLAGLQESDVQRAREWVRAGSVKVDVDRDRQGIYIKTLFYSAGETFVSVIQSQHDNITGLFYNDTAVENPFGESPEKKGTVLTVDKLEKELRSLTLSRALELVQDLDKEDMRFIEQGIDMNMRLANFGLENECGHQVGRTLRDLENDWLNSDMVHESRVYTSAAADARMAGVSLPAMSSAGSGNHGLTAIIPLKIVAEKTGAAREELCRAVALSHVITACVKSYTGRLSAICACSVASGAGAAAGVACMLGCNRDQIGAAINNIIEDLAGVICDGAKNSCALKLATASGNAVTAALFALRGVSVQGTEGIIGFHPIQTVANIGRLSSRGMVETDRLILEIMLNKITDRG